MSSTRDGDGFAVSRHSRSVMMMMMMMTTAALEVVSKHAADYR